MPTTVGSVSRDDVGGDDGKRDDERLARRIEVGVYVFAGVALVVLGVFLTSKILNWIIGPAFIVAVVTTVTPLALRVAGVRDPDARTRRGATEGERTA
jgi:hypothetical protein